MNTVKLPRGSWDQVLYILEQWNDNAIILNIWNDIQDQIDSQEY